MTRRRIVVDLDGQHDADSDLQRVGDVLLRAGLAVRLVSWEHDESGEPRRVISRPASPDLEERDEAIRHTYGELFR